MQNQIKIRKSKYEDIDEILRISQLNTITNLKDTSSGFLVSGYTKEKYIEYLDSTECFYVAVIEEKIVGVLLGFNKESIQTSDIVNSLIKYSLTTEFVLIKQIFVDPEFHNKGVANELYNSFIETLPQETSLACVIVDTPFNFASVNFHTKMGFEKILQITPEADFDGTVRERSVWFRKSKKVKNLNTQSLLRVTSIDTSETKNVLLANLQNTTGLYTHEDNLNWTKLGMLVTFVFALCAGFSHYYEQKDFTSFVLASLIIILGFSISYLFDQKIKSGLMYMNNHKENLKKIESKLKHYCPNYERTIAVKNKKISEQSTTSNIMHAVPTISYFIWGFLSVLIIIKLI